jgi:hypothetical protein
VLNGNDDKALNNNANGDQIHGSLHGQNNNICKKLQQVPEREGAICNNPQQFNENSNYVTTPQCKGVAETDKDMPIGQLFFAFTRQTPPPIGPTLARLGNG